MRATAVSMLLRARTVDVDVLVAYPISASRRRSGSTSPAPRNGKANDGMESPVILTVFLEINPTDIDRSGW
jgi:hypothetical protein